MHTAQNDTLTAWDDGIKIDLENYLDDITDSYTCYYYFINRDSNYGRMGDDKECGQYAYLFFTKLQPPTPTPPTPPTPTPTPYYGMARVKFEFDE